MHVLMLGTGYVGQVTGACLAKMGHIVKCLDIDQAKIESLKRGIIPLYEPGLEELVKKYSAEGRLSFTTHYEPITEPTICFLALPTPSSPDGRADLSYFEAALTSLIPVIQSYTLVVTKSTVPVGTTQAVKERLAQKLDRDLFDVVSNPEFLKEGNGVADFLNPDRIILGVDALKAERLMRQLYAPLNLAPERIFCMDFASAEMTKYAANCILASRISFMNEISGLCEQLGADIGLVSRGIGADPRIGPSFLSAGVGFGGSCFPKDLDALRALAKAHSYPTPLLDATVAVNARHKHLLAKKLREYFASRGGLQNKTVAIWGLAFKPGTDDIREAPSLTLIRSLLEEGAILRLYDPVAQKHVKALFGALPQLHFCKNAYEAAERAHAIALVTEWKEFAEVDFAKVASSMSGGAVFDGRNLYNPQKILSYGLDYFGIGKPVPVWKEPALSL